LGKVKSNAKIWLENLKERDLLEDSGVDGKILLLKFKEPGREGMFLIERVKLLLCNTAPHFLALTLERNEQCASFRTQFTLSVPISRREAGPQSQSG
jgi:hypothetical protein